MACSWFRSLTSGTAAVFAAGCKSIGRFQSIVHARLAGPVLCIGLRRLTASSSLEQLQSAAPALDRLDQLRPVPRYVSLAPRPRSIQSPADFGNLVDHIAPLDVAPKGAPQKTELARHPRRFADQQPAGDGNAAIRQGQAAESEGHVEKGADFFDCAIYQGCKNIRQAAVDGEVVQPDINAR